MIVSALTLLHTLTQSISRPVARIAWRMHRDQVGAGYSLSVVMMLPLYMLFMGIIIEVQLLLNSYHAISSASQVAGHTARAWLIHRDSLATGGSSLEQIVHECVARNMLPFAIATPNLPVASPTALTTAWRNTGLDASTSQHYTSKLDYLRQALRIKLIPQKRQTDGIWIQLEYDSPLYLHVFEPILATSRRDAIPVRTIAAQTWVALPPGDATHTMPGISYEPLRATSWRKLN